MTEKEVFDLDKAFLLEVFNICSNQKNDNRWKDCLFIVYTHIRVNETALTMNPEDNSKFSEENNNPLYIVLISKI